MGGDELSIYDAPYQVSIFYYNSHLCGGAIINSNYIVTAGHCLFQIRSAQKLKVYAGVNNVSDVQSAVYREVESFRVHEGFTIKSQGHVINDVALIKLARPLPLNRKSLPIKLARKEPSPGDMVTVSGYGLLKEDGKADGHLYGVSVPTVDKAKCKRVYISYGIGDINEQVICAGYDQGGKDACQGDSGGPAVSNGALVGVVSYGIGCARPHIPGVYTNIAHYVGWINSHLAYY